MQAVAQSPIPRLRGWRRYFIPSYWGDHRARRRIDDVCIGYSRFAHWEFFRHVLAKEEVHRVLVLGVYYGRDVAYIAWILGALRRSGVHITGVDKFEDAACADWSEDLIGRSWREAGFGEAPAIQLARDNLDRLGLDTHVTLRRGLAEDYLAASDALFDLIYIDTSHDYRTTRRTIELAIPRVAPGGLIAGDDFSDQGTWGVVRAVRESFEHFSLHENWIWYASPAASHPAD